MKHFYIIFKSYMKNCKNCEKLYNFSYNFGKLYEIFCGLYSELYEEKANSRAINAENDSNVKIRFAMRMENWIVGETAAGLTAVLSSGFGFGFLNRSLRTISTKDWVSEVAPRMIRQTGMPG